ncbi:hypothetical protein IAU60_000547 [Kwoniella sp. DSM 27419]
MTSRRTTFLADCTPEARQPRRVRINSTAIIMDDGASSCSSTSTMLDEDDLDSAPASPSVSSTSSLGTGVWLCSRPSRFTAPCASPDPVSSEFRSTSCPLTLPSALRVRRSSRPLIVRTVSTGRLATEYDDQGRIMCMSNHSDRMLKPSPTVAPASRGVFDRLRSWRSSVSAQSTPSPASSRPAHGKTAPGKSIMKPSGGGSKDRR